MVPPGIRGGEPVADGVASTLRCLGEMKARRFAPLSLLCFLVPAALAAAGLAGVACSSTAPVPVGPVSEDAGVDARSPLPDAAPDQTSPDAADAGGGDAGEDAPAAADCGALLLLHPIITVESVTGAPIACDATFAPLDLPDGGSSGASLGATLCGPSITFAGCPAPPADGGIAPCTYVLLALGGAPSSPIRVEVAEPGFESAVVSGVESGAGGCAPPVPASNDTVKLVPLAVDAGADGH